MNIMLFDMDGTLATSGKIIDSEVANVLNKIKRDIGNIELGIVGGGKFEKILSQLDNKIPVEHIFSECGSVYHRRNLHADNNVSYEEIYKRDIRTFKNYKEINVLIKIFLKYLSEVDYLISGNFVDLRNGLVYLSLVGMSANDSERCNFILLDKVHNYRTKLLEILRAEAVRLEIDNKVEILLGGSVGIAIYPTEWNKIQVTEIINKTVYENIYYFGDQHELNGNDYRLLNHPDVIGVKVDCIDDTMSYLKQFISL